MTGRPSRRADAADDGQVVAVHAVAVQFVKSVKIIADVVERVGPLRVARQLGDLPGREIGEDRRGQLPALGLQSADLLLDVDAPNRSHMTQFLDLCLEFGDRLFEFQEIDGH